MTGCWKMTSCHQIWKLFSLVASCLVLLRLWPSYYYYLHLSFLICNTRRLSYISCCVLWNTGGQQRTNWEFGGDGEYGSRLPSSLIQLAKSHICLFYIFGFCDRLDYWSANNRSLPSPSWSRYHSPVLLTLSMAIWLTLEGEKMWCE